MRQTWRWRRAAHLPHCGGRVDARLPAKLLLHAGAALGAGRASARQLHPLLCRKKSQLEPAEATAAGTRPPAAAAVENQAQRPRGEPPLLIPVFYNIKDMGELRRQLDQHLGAGLAVDAQQLLRTCAS